MQNLRDFIQRGAALEKAGQLDDAIREHEAALAVDPKNAQVHINLISLYGRAGDAIKARQHFDQAVQLSPGRPDAWYNYGVLLFHEKDYADAEQAFRRAVRVGGGWMPMLPKAGDPEILREPIATLRAQARADGKPEPEVVVLTELPLDDRAAATARIRAFADIGATRVGHSSRYADAAELARAADALAAARP